MCSGCTTLGNNTMFGSGKSRAVPPNSLRASSSFIVVQELPRIGPMVGRRIELYSRNQCLVGPQVAPGQVLSFPKYFRKTNTHCRPKRLLIETLMGIGIRRHVCTCGFVELGRAPQVAIAEMI